MDTPISREILESVRPSTSYILATFSSCLGLSFLRSNRCLPMGSSSDPKVPTYYEYGNQLPLIAHSSEWAPALLGPRMLSMLSATFTF